MNKTTYCTYISVISTIVALALCGCASEADEYIPNAPDYDNETMWHITKGDATGEGADVFYLVSTWEMDWKTSDSMVCHYADVWSKNHRDRMDIEFTRIAEYMADGNNFYAPYYRHTTIEAFLPEDDNLVYERMRIPMKDIKAAFENFNSRRDTSRPFIIAGFSQGAAATVELVKSLNEDQMKHLVAAYVIGYKVTPSDTLESRNLKAAQGADDTGVIICYNTVKDVKYILKMTTIPGTMCINPVNWSTDSIPGKLNDTVTVVTSPTCKVLVTDYPAHEYKPILGKLNMGDIHSGEPWLYSECLRENFHVRTKAWRAQQSK
ncbi:MAG: DUF3089 domain-containing protein [Bacteroidales bacterium]|nr:DUF3089 domain-containing protein [Bacteroidales bacterium]